MKSKAVAGVVSSKSLTQQGTSRELEDWFSSREHLREDFIDKAGWPGAVMSQVGEDCAFRRYLRLRIADKTAILMEAVPDGHRMATPGHKVGDYIRIGMWLNDHGINVPRIYEADPANGYVLLEDFGRDSFKACIQKGVNKKNLYGLATDVLGKFRVLPFEENLKLPFYHDSHVHEGRRRLVDWYVPVIKRKKNTKDMAEEFLAVWQSITSKLPPCPSGFLHVDYHVENLMYLPDREGVQQCGLLDFQGAMFGPAVYDLSNLLEDPRFEIDSALRQEMFDRYCADMTAEEKETCRIWYRVMATQFHCRVIGQFIKLALVMQKKEYLQYIPRLEGYLKEGVKDPILKPLAEWFKAQDISFNSEMTKLGQDAQSFISKGAF